MNHCNKSDESKLHPCIMATGAMKKDGKKNEKPNWEITFYFLRDNFYHIYNVEIWDNSTKNFLFKKLYT